MLENDIKYLGIPKNFVSVRNEVFISDTNNSWVFSFNNMEENNA
jgi:hypothetical protein